MKILVVGSLRPPEKPDDKPDQQFVTSHKAQFDAACFALGEALTRKGHSIMVGVPDWPTLQQNNTVATFILEGINNVPAKDSERHPVFFYGPEERAPADQTPTGTPDSLQELKKLPNILIKDTFVGSGTSKARVIPNVAEVDAVMIISGREGTENIGYAAYSMKKPVIAITSFGGAAENMANDTLLEVYNRLSQQGDATPSDVRALLDVDWGDDPQKNLDNAAAIVEIIEKLVKAFDLSDKRTLRVLKATIAGLVILLMGWAACYLSANQCTAGSQSCSTYVGVSFFLLLYISALLGSGLRTLVMYQQNKVTRLTFLGLGIDLVISMLVAFGLALIYLIGGISFTGKVVVLDIKNADQNLAFTTVAISMSLLGLAAGYLLPLKELTKRLENIIAQQDK